MKTRKIDNEYVLVLEQNEPVLQTLTEFCKTNSIENAAFSGIGAVKELICGYYALDEKEYYFTEYPDLVEAVSVTGNVMIKEGEPFIHVHGVFTDHDNNAFGGHIKEMTVGATLEVFMRTYESALAREHDEQTGLHLIDCKE